MSAHKLPSVDFAWTPNLAYVIGLLATDGNLSKDGRHITLRSTDIQLLETFKKCLNLKESITETLYVHKDGYHRKRSYRIQPSMAQFHRWLLTIGLSPAKTYTIGALDIPHEYFPDFLRGHLDGDGTITTYKDYYNTYKNPKYIYTRLWLRFVSASENHIHWLQTKIFSLTAIHGHLWVYRTTKGNKVPFWQLKFGKKDSIKLLNWMYYNKDVPCLKRKRIKARPFLI